MTKKLLLSFSLILVSFFSVSAHEIDLSESELSIYSQNGEDGIIARIFNEIGTNSRFCVEFGATDGITNSNTYLLRLQEWQAVLLDRMYEKKEFSLFKEFIIAENITDLFMKYGVPFDFDLLSIDIDYNDFYVWKSLDAQFNPAVVVIEYNATHLPSEDKVVKYQPYFCGGGTNYYGASILAMYNLGRSKGYSLVYADSNGVNLFFIRDDILRDQNLHFKHVNDVEKLYRKPKYGNGPNGGHPADQKNRSYLSSQELLNEL